MTVPVRGQDPRPPSTLARAARAAAVVLLAVSGLLVVAGADRPAHALAEDPTISIVQNQLMATTTTLVQLDHWPAGRVDVMVCGDDARRASTDCDLVHAGAVTVPVAGTARVRLPPPTPPIGCPCVVRASAQETPLVRTLRLDLPGVPRLTAEQTPPDPNAGPPATHVSRAGRAASLASSIDLPEGVVRWWPGVAVAGIVLLALAAVARRRARRGRVEDLGPAAVTDPGPTPSATAVAGPSRAVAGASRAPGDIQVNGERAAGERRPTPR